MTALDRFYDKVVVEATERWIGHGPCHWWVGARTRGGKHSSQRKRGGKRHLGLPYPNFWFEGKLVRGHRWLWELFKGLIPAGYDLDHLCNNHLCVNLNHLEPKLPVANSVRANKGRKKAA